MMMIRTFAAAVLLVAGIAFAQNTPSTTQAATTQAASTQPANALESFAVESIAFLNQLNQTLDAVSDETSAKAALPKLDQAARDFAKMKETTQKMPKPSDEAMEKLMAKYGAQLQAAAATLGANQARVRADPKIEAIIGKRLNDLQVIQATTEEN